VTPRYLTSFDQGIRFPSRTIFSAHILWGIFFVALEKYIFVNTEIRGSFSLRNFKILGQLDIRLLSILKSFFKVRFLWQYI
jgi:hypothetical protein